MDKHEDIKTLIRRRRFQILVHSYIYYRLNKSVIPNWKFDMWAKELIDLQKEYPHLSEETDLYEMFKDFLTIGCAEALPLDGDDALAKRAVMLVHLIED